RVTATTDGDGRFRADGLLPGLEYRLRLDRGGKRTPVFGAVTLRPGGARDLGEAKAVPKEGILVRNVSEVPGLSARRWRLGQAPGEAAEPGDTGRRRRWVSRGAVPVGSPGFGSLTRGFTTTPPPGAKPQRGGNHRAAAAGRSHRRVEFTPTPGRDRR